MHADDILAKTSLRMARHSLLEAERRKMKINVEVVGKLFLFGIEERLLFGNGKFEVFRSLAVLGNKELTKTFLGGTRIVGAVRCELRIVPAAEMDSDYAFGEPFTLQPRYDLAQDIVHVREIDLGAVRNPWPAAIAIRFFVLARKVARVHVLPFADARRSVGIAPDFVRMLFRKFRVCGSIERKDDKRFRRNAHHIADVAHRAFDIPDPVRPVPRAPDLERLQPYAFAGKAASVEISPRISPAVGILVDDGRFFLSVNQKPHPTALLHDFGRMVNIGGNATVENYGIFEIGLSGSGCRVFGPELLPCGIGRIIILHAPTVPYRNRRRPGDYQRR